MTVFSPSGAKSLLVDDQLAQQDLALLAVLDFLCECGSAHPARNLLFKPQEVRHRLLLLLKQKDFGKALHLRAVGGRRWRRLQDGLHWFQFTFKCIYF